MTGSEPSPHPLKSMTLGGFLAFSGLEFPDLQNGGNYYLSPQIMPIRESTHPKCLELCLVLR